MIEVLHGDCVVVMQGMEPDTFDAIVCDPPYGLEFMGKEWDSLAAPLEDVHGNPVRSNQDPRMTELGKQRGGGDPFVGKGIRFAAGVPMQAWHEAWGREALRVLKPGGHLLAFGGTRTYHRLTCALEDAGFEIRDCLMWLYGQGFPKSLDVSKAIDKVAGAKREVVSTYTRGRAMHPGNEGTDQWRENYTGEVTVSAPATDAAREWSGWGTALKPAWEPIILARKPLIGTVAANVLKHGTGALNIDGSRIGLEERPIHIRTKTITDATSMSGKSTGSTPSGETIMLGRWPANVLLSHAEGCELVGTKKVNANQSTTPGSGRGPDETPGKSIFGDKMGGKVNAHYADADGKETVEDWRCVEDCPVRLLDEQSGERPSPWIGNPGSGRKGGQFFGGGENRPVEKPEYRDTGGASRFFYNAKAPGNERWALCKTCDVVLSPADRKAHDSTHTLEAHPTQKPEALMQYLIRLVTPPGGTVLTPFSGSGSTIVAAKNAGFSAVGIEQSADYVRISCARAGLEAIAPEAAKDSQTAQTAQTAQELDPWLPPSR